MSYDFQTTTHGKWILAGEHSVVRGHSALVFPIPSKTLTLSFTHHTLPCKAHYEGAHGNDMHLLFFSVLEHALALLGKSINDINGEFHLSNAIPIGAGMGASAALCVCVARWMEYKQWLNHDTVFNFAKKLEDLFHGRSSGVDIAGVSNLTGAYFKQGQQTELVPTWHPHWYLSSCEQRGITSHCIEQVQALWVHKPNEAKAIDTQMEQAVLKARTALESQQGNFAMLAEAINDAGTCFKQWGLISENLNHHLSALKNAGAIAVKPTGSGFGGYVISLWETLPPITPFELILV